MGNSASDGIKFIVGLLVTLLIVGAVWAVVSLALRGASNATSQTERDVNQMNESRYTQYENEKITGSEVLNMLSRFGSEKIAIGVVCTPTDESSIAAAPTAISGTAFNYTDVSLSSPIDATTTQNNLRNAKDPGNAAYINPSKMFFGQVIRNTNTDAIVGLQFTCLK